MLFHDADAPSPRRVRIFLAEKGLDIPRRTLSLARREQFDPAYLARNPRATVPLLELDDGTCLWDTLAICDYLEALHPQPPLLGRTPLERAEVVMWYQRIEFEGFLAVMDVLRNAAPFFKDHAITGTTPAAQIPALVERGNARIAAFYSAMDARLAASPFVAGANYTLADIQLLCVVDFAAGFGRMPVPEGCQSLAEWRRRMNERPGVAE